VEAEAVEEDDSEDGDTAQDVEAGHLFFEQMGTGGRRLRDFGALERSQTIFDQSPLLGK
jgi:hypothetical protein